VQPNRHPHRVDVLEALGPCQQNIINGQLLGRVIFRLILLRGVIQGLYLLRGLIKSQKLCHQCHATTDRYIFDRFFVISSFFY
jgi:hypothetical protein